MSVLCSMCNWSVCPTNEYKFIININAQLCCKSVVKLVDVLIILASAINTEIYIETVLQVQTPTPNSEFKL